MSDYIGYANFPTLDQVLSPSKPVEDIDWIAQRLTRSGTSWSGSLGHGVTVTWSASATDQGQASFAGNVFAQLNADQIHAAEMATRAWSDVANINFVRVGSGYSGSAAYSNAGQIKIQGYSSTPTGAAGMSDMPGHGSVVTEVATGGGWEGSYQWVPDGFNAAGGYANLLHELGHAIGLSHPDDYATPFPQYDSASSYYQATKLFSIMAYPDGRVGVLGVWQDPMTPGIDDIAAAQRLYGANMTTRTGDTTYGFNSNADEPYFRITGDPNQSFVRFTVWDAGGNDTFDFSGYAYNHVIDLREGHLSSVSHLSPDFGNVEGYNVGIAYGTVIENAIGGSGGEMMYGNDANNHIVGNGGADFINGGAGQDTLEGGDDNDHIYGNGLAGVGAADGGDSILGGAGHDYINGNAGNDTISGGDGNDRIQGGQDDDLINGDVGVDQINGNLGNDTIHGGDGNDLLQGGKGDDQVYGDAGNDTLMGNLGVDVLTGGAGADVFKFAFGDAVIVNGQPDRITDFQADDRISLDFGVPTQVLHASGTALASAATAAHDALIAAGDAHAVEAVQIGGDTYLFFDARSDGYIEAIDLAGVAASTVDAHDFV